MLHPARPTSLPICPYCGEPGLHESMDACLLTLREAIGAITRARQAPAPREVMLPRWSAYRLARKAG